MAKKLLIGHRSALLIYRAAGSGLTETPVPYHAPVGPTDYTTRIRDFMESGNVQSLMDSGTLDLIAFSQNMRHNSDRCCMHLLPSELPKGSFCSLGNNVLVASPALTLFLLSQQIAHPSASNLPPWCDELVKGLGPLGVKVAIAEIASELCGIYSIAPNGKGTLERHAAFTTIETMRSYMRRLSHRKYASIASSALRMTSPLSASPRETQLYLAMTSPWPYGYGLPFPNANHPIVIVGQELESDEDCRTIRFSDYFWHRKKLRNGRVRQPVVLEYDSDEFHSASAGLTDRQLADQAERRDSIEAMGHGFIRITTEHTRDFDAFDRKMRQLSKLLRIDLPKRSADEHELAETFFSLVFDSKRFCRVGVYR